MRLTYLMAAVVIAVSTLVYAEAPLNLPSSNVPKKVTDKVQQYAKKLNINTVSFEELVEIKGLGKKKAKAILLYREQNGTIEHLDDLENIKGIGAKSVAKLKKYLKADANI